MRGFLVELVSILFLLLGEVAGATAISEGEGEVDGLSPAK